MTTISLPDRLNTPPSLRGGPPRDGWHDQSVQQRLPSLLETPILFAHRGARAQLPDNTIESFALALRLGATGLESDVWITADGVPVLDHDGVVKVGRRKREIPQCQSADLPAHIPSLAGLFAECGTDYHLSLDLKQNGIGAAVIDAVRTIAPDLLPRLWLCHPGVEELAALRLHDSATKLVNSTRLSRMSRGPERRAATLAEVGIDAVNLHHSDWTGGLSALFHRFDRVAFGWDMQFDHVLRPAIRMGLDGVYSDHVDAMVDALAAEYVPPGSVDLRSRVI
jgi:glycerophosphoryl diester phosphodiesterase